MSGPERDALVPVADSVASERRPHGAGRPNVVAPSQQESTRRYGFPVLVRQNIRAKILSEIPSKLIRLAMLVLAARWLGRSAFGAYSYALALGYILVQFADLGLQFHLAREVSRDPAAGDVVLARVLKSKLCLLAVVVAAFLAVGMAVSSAQDRWLVWILGAALILNSFVELGNYLFRGFQRLAFEAKINLLNVALGSISGLTAVHLGKGPIGLASGLLLGAAVAFAATLLTVHRRFVPCSRWFRNQGGWLDALRPSIPIGVATLLSILYFRIDVLFLERYRGPDTVGLYAAAYRIVESFMFLPSILLAAVFPAFAELTVREVSRLLQLLRASLLWLLALSGVLATGLLVFAGPLLRAAFGDSYLPAAVPLRILSPGLVLIFVNYALTHFLIALDRARMNVLLAAICLAVNVSCNWILVPRYGMNAAAGTTVVTEAVLCGLALAMVLAGIRTLHLPGRTGGGT